MLFNKYSRDISKYLFGFVCCYSYQITVRIRTLFYSIQVMLFGIVTYLRYEICPKQFTGVYDFSLFSTSRVVNNSNKHQRKPSEGLSKNVHSRENGNIGYILHTTQKNKKRLQQQRGWLYTYLLSKQLLRLFPHSNDLHLQYTDAHKMCLVFYFQKLHYPCKDIFYHSRNEAMKNEDVNGRGKSKDN